MIISSVVSGQVYQLKTVVIVKEWNGVEIDEPGYEYIGP